MNKKYLTKIASLSLIFIITPAAALAATSSYNAWFSSVWLYASVIILPISTIMIIFAGFLWSASGGDPGKISKAKEIIWGVVSGLGFLLLSYWLITQVIGIPIDVFNNAGGSSLWNP